MKISYELGDGTIGSAKVYSGDLRFVNKSTLGGNYPIYEIEADNDDIYSVAFYKQVGGTTSTWDLYDLHFVERGNNFADHKMPSNPTYGGSITFINWDHNENGGDPFLPYEDINEDTVLYGQVLVAGNQGGTVLHVMNTENALLNRYLELYQAQEGADQNTTISDVEINTIMVSSATQEKNTNPDFRENGWNDGHTHYVVHNREVPGTAAEGWNHHIALTDIASVTINGKVGDKEFKVEIPVSENPGDFSVVSVDSMEGGVMGIIAELIINPKPADPDYDDWGDEENPTGDDLYAQTGVVVDCTNGTAGHTDGEYELVSTEGTMKWSTEQNAYVYEIEVKPDAYVGKYNTENTGTTHTLSPDNQSGTIVLVFRDGKWSAVDGESTVTFTVTCEGEQGGGDPGTEPEKPDEEVIATNFGENAVKVFCTWKPDNHVSKTYNLTADAIDVGEPYPDGDTYYCDVTIFAASFVSQYTPDGVKHELADASKNTGSFKLYYDGDGAKWLLAEGQNKPYVIFEVTCKDGGSGGEPEEPNEPTAPTYDDLEDLIKVTVDCTNTQINPAHPNGNYELMQGTYDVVKASTGDTWTVTVRSGDYIVNYEKENGNVPHGLTNDTDTGSETVSVVKEGDDWKLANGSAPTTITFEVKCGSTIVEVPGEGEDHWYPVYVDPEDPTDPDQTGVSDLLETDDHIQYLFGYPDGSFGPDRNMTRAEAAQMFYNLLKNKNVDAEPAFDDVPEGAWYATPVNVMAELGIVNGVGDDKFEPNREITRAEFTTMAMRFAKVPSGGVNIFTDVNPDDWFYSYVVNSIQYGWIEGYGDGTFRPDRLITRAEVTTIVNRMLDRQADMAYVIQHRAELNQFTDLTTEHWAYYTIVEATNEHDYKKPAIGEDWTSLKK